MSIEVLPVGITCQLKCTYCYENSIRDNDPAQRYNRDAVLKAVDKLDGRWELFGGEALILPLPQLEELFKIGFKKWGGTGVQTNGALITKKHIKLFKKYKTHVGISLDGPDELNDSRWAGTVEATRKATARTHWAIKALCKAKHTPSIIVTLHAGNCSKERFPKFCAWVRELDAMGIKEINPHTMELDSKADSLYLPHEELIDRLIDLWNLQDDLKQLKFTKFQEVLKLMQGDDHVSCVWHSCDPMNTGAVQAVNNNGEAGLCLRTQKDGKTWLPAEGDGHDAPLIGHPGKRAHVRQLALYVTPQEVGGCKDCEYFMACQGNCPGEGENGDWRMRSHYCATYKRLFAEASKRLRAVGIRPLPDFEHRIGLEKKMMAIFAKGNTTSYGELVKQQKEMAAKGMPTPVDGGWHGDHNDC